MNRLANTTSPYLRQHVDNPVHWWPWADGAFEEAKARKCPVIVSIGYSACHWCHVMAHECFEDDEVAAAMNANFVSIKVDREERPDVDALYMDALHALGEQGGWPLTMFVSPDREPIWGGTYFPKHSKYGRPGFLDVLAAVRKTWDDDPDRIAHNTRALTDFLKQKNASGANSGSFQSSSNFITNLLEIQDTERGGIKGAPKFPNAPLLDALWMAWLADGNTHAREAFHRTIEALCRGGIYDHLGGGLSRYSTDARWLAPHFEKMLYDNAHFVRHLAWAHGDRNHVLYRHCAIQTVQWLEREMLTPSGAFASALDADSEGEEGKFYVWDRAEIDRLLGDDAPAFAAAYDVSPSGNWESKTILNLLGAEDDALPAIIENNQQARERLLDHRGSRIHPGRDDKVLTDWNALMIEALVIASPVFEQPRWIDLANHAFEAMPKNGDGTIIHARLGEGTSDSAFLTDHAALLNAALALQTAGVEVGNILARDDGILPFLDDEQTPYMVTGDKTDIPVRPLAIQDEANPAGSSQTLMALTRLNAIEPDVQRAALIDAMTATTESLLANSRQGPGSHHAFRLWRGTLALVIIISPGKETDSWRDHLLALGRPDILVQTAETPEDLPENHAGRALPPAERTFASLCRRQTCSPPYFDLDALLSALNT